MINRYGETLEQCVERLKREKITPTIASQYASNISHTFDAIRDDHNARFYSEVAIRLSAMDDARQDTPARA